MTRAPRSAKDLRCWSLTLGSPTIGADATSTAAKLYWRMHQLNVKNAYTKTTARHSSLTSERPRLTGCANGRSARSETARSDAPKAVRIPARMISVLDAKNDA